MDLPYHTPLSSEQQRQLGIDPAQPLAMADQVRYSQLDVQNHVNNTVYMEWFARLRIRYLDEVGIQGEAAARPRIVIRSGTIHWRQEMHANEDFVATCGCVRFRHTSMSLVQQIWAGGTLRATFDCVIVLLTPDGAARFPIPDALRHHLETVDGAVLDG